eukprot:3136615-Rhodomonas_salina.4
MLLPGPAQRRASRVFSHRQSPGTPAMCLRVPDIHPVLNRVPGAHTAPNCWHDTTRSCIATQLRDRFAVLHCGYAATRSLIPTQYKSVGMRLRDRFTVLNCA